MHRSIPHPLRRVHSLLLHIDAASIVFARMNTDALIATAQWLQIHGRQQRATLATTAPVLVALLDQVQAKLAAGHERDLARQLHTTFGIGMVAGCHLRDLAEQDQPTECTIRFEDAIGRLEQSDLRQTLWAIGLPEEQQAILGLVARLSALVPMLPLRLLVASELSRGSLVAVPRQAEELLFFFGMLAAGISPPRLSVRTSN
jgi:hypothetical protein